MLNHWAGSSQQKLFLKGWKPSGEDSNSSPEAKLSSGSLLRGQARSQETKGIFPLLRKWGFLSLFYYLIPQMGSKLKCLLQVNNHPFLAEQIRAQELGMGHFKQHRCLDCLKMDLRRLWNAIDPGRASLHAPNKLCRRLHCNGSCTGTMCRFGFQGRAWLWMLDHVRQQDGNQGITHPVIQAKVFLAPVLCSASPDYSIQHPY